MKKMKKLNLNKIRVVSLRSLQTVNGGYTGTPCVDTHHCPDPPTITLDPDTCYSTSNTYQDGDGGTFRSSGPPPTQACSAVLTECELADI